MSSDFPIFLPGSARDAFATDCPRSIPYALLQAIPQRRILHNHGLTLDVLASRGGLDPREIHALFLGVKLTIGQGETMHDGVAFVRSLVNGSAPSPAPWIESEHPLEPPPVIIAAPTPPPAPEPTPIVATVETPPHGAIKRYQKVMRQLGPATLKMICAYSGASKGAVHTFLQRYQHELVASTPGAGIDGHLWTWIGPIEEEMTVDAAAPPPPEPTPVTELAAIPPKPPPTLSPPSDALIKKTKRGVRGPQASLLLEYRDVVVALEPAPTHLIARHLKRSISTVRQWLDRHGEYAQVHSRKGSDAYWTWVGSRIGVQPIPPLVEVEDPPPSIGVADRPIPSPIASSELATDDLSGDDDLAPLLAPSQAAPAANLTLGDKPIIMVPKHLLEALLDGPDQYRGVRDLVEFAHRTFDVPRRTVAGGIFRRKFAPWVKERAS
jgi:hypothetical protein